MSHKSLFGAPSHVFLAVCFAVSLGCGGSGNGGGSSISSGGVTGSGGPSSNAGTTGAAAGATDGLGGTSNKGGSATGAGGSSVAGSSVAGGSSATGGKGGSLATGGSGANGGRSSSTSIATGGTGSSAGTTAGGGTNTSTASANGGSTSKDGGVGGSASGGSGPGGSGAAGSTGSADGGAGGAKQSAGCGKAPTKLKNALSADIAKYINTVSVSGKGRQFFVRWPDDYKNDKPHRLVLDYHGAGGKVTDHAGDGYCGLWSLANGSTIFISMGADGGIWNASNDLLFTDEVLKVVEAELCIDTSRVFLEGFSQGAAMVRVLGCQRPGVFRALICHSAGGLTMPSSCKPIPYFGSLGLGDIMPNSQATQTDPFAKWNGCTMDTLPTAPAGKHVCTPYKGCPAEAPVTWCSYDGGHDYRPKDSGASSSWMPSAVWPFITQF